MILVTGDIHGRIDIGKLSNTKNKALKHITKKMTKDDFLIICGDFGLVWNNDKDDLWWRKWLDEKPYTTLFVDGNHENYDLLEQFKEVDFHGGRARKIGKTIYHLMRGQMFELQGKRFFTFGGAECHDKEYRTYGESIWERELPEDFEYERALQTLEANGYKTDYIITHCASSSVQKEIEENFGLRYCENRLTRFFEEIESKIDYKVWFCGHYHMDRQSAVQPKLRILYRKIMIIE